MNQFRNFSVIEGQKLKTNLLNTLLRIRINDFCIVIGIDHGREACYHVLADCNKRQLLQEQRLTGSINVAERGKLLESAWGHDTPQSFINRQAQFIADLCGHKLVVVKLQREGCEQIYYMVSDVARENNFITASSEDEIRHIGRILYCTRDEDPAESFCEIIEQVYFGLAVYESPSDNELFDSVRKGELQRVSSYLAEGGDVNFADEHGRSLLQLAAHSGNLKVISFLKVKGADIHSEDKMCGRKPIHIAAKEAHPDVISFFLEMGVSINECDKIKWTPLHYAVWNGNLNTIRYLIEKGADVNAKEAYAGKTPIHIAAEHAYIDVLKYLIDVGANIADGGNEESRTPLYYSVVQGHFETIKFLICKGADKNTKTKQNKTLLHVAILANDKDIIEFLVKAGLEIDGKDSDGLTPLHYTVTNHKLDMLQVLADLGADLFAADNDGKYPLTYAHKKEHADMALHIVYRMCKKLQEEGKYNDAMQLYNENLEIIKKLREDRPEYLEIRNKIGVILYQIGQYDEAETTFKDVLENRERCLGANHFATLSTKHGLALVYGAQMRYSEAMEILNQVLRTQKTISGEDHDFTLNVSHDIAKVHFKKGKYDEALELFERVFEKRNKHFGSDHPKTLQARQDMAVMFVNKREFEKALRIFKEVLQKRVILLGENHPDTISTIYHVKLTSEKVKEMTPQDQRCSIS